jgi:hypothetical protein
MRIGWTLVSAGVVLMGSGCHSPYVNAVVSNRTSETVSLVEVDYPSASFGTQTLAPGQDFKYRFKVMGSGDLKVLWTDAERKDHTVNGPELKEGDEGGLQVVLRPGGVDWVPSLKK